MATTERTANEIAERVRQLAQQTGNREIVERVQRIVSGSLLRGDSATLLKAEANLVDGLARGGV